MISLPPNLVTLQLYSRCAVAAGLVNFFTVNFGKLNIAAAAVVSMMYNAISAIILMSTMKGNKVDSV